MSPLLFCLTEDVLSRGLSHLVAYNRLKLIKACRNVLIPSHTLYVDDIMLFTKGCTSSLDAIAELFVKYIECLGQVCNPFKSILYVGSMSTVRHGLLATRIGFKMGFLPFLYLRVPIFKGKLKASYFHSVVVKIKNKLVACKVNLLSIAGRFQLVSFVIHNIMLYSFRIYSWSVSLTHEIETWCRNFIWSGDIHKRKLAIVAWKFCCHDLKDKVLGIKSLRTTNESNNLVQC